MKNKNIEKRAATVEAAEQESRTISGYAAVFDSNSEDLGGFTERIERGAFLQGRQAELYASMKMKEG